LGKEQPIYIAEGTRWIHNQSGQYRKEKKKILCLCRKTSIVQTYPILLLQFDVAWPRLPWRGNSQLTVVTIYIWPSNVCLQRTDKCVSQAAKSSGDAQSFVQSSKENRQVTQLRSRQLQTRMTETVDKRLTCKEECFETRVGNTWLSANAVSRLT
jgi:hypothetical protein